MVPLPVEVTDIIATYVQEPQPQAYGPEIEWHLGNEHWRRDIANLRLVNTNFAFCLEHVLFQDLQYTLDFKTGAGSRRLTGLLHLSQSPLSRHVKSLKIALGDASDCSEPHGESQTNEASLAAAVFQGLAYNLPLCLRGLRSLRSLSLFCRDGIFLDRPEELIPHEHSQQLDKITAMILAQLEHQSLAHLTLRIPSTDNIHDIIADRQDTLYPQIRGTLADFMSGLNSLTLKLSYSSGRLERVYPRTPNMIVHIVKSHGKYYQDMFDFAAMATSLKSLRIHFTAPYRLDQLKLKGFRVLKALSLSGIRTTGQPLLSLLAQNKTSLESVFLHRIELIEKSWEDVLVVLCESPLLTSVAFQSCINAAHGRFSQYNFHITPGNVDITPASVDITPGSIDSRDLEPERLHDHTALRALIRLVNGRTRESRLSEPELAF